MLAIVPTLAAQETELAQLSARIEAATHRQLTLIRSLDAAEVWADQGAKTCASWLAWRIELSPGAARERVRVARALGELPAIDAAMQRGRLSFSKARALTRVATADNESDLLEVAFASTAAQLERICRGLRRVRNGDGNDDNADKAPPEREVALRSLGDGTTQLCAKLLPDEAAQVMEALVTVRDQLRDERGADPAPNLADALVHVAERFAAEPAFAEASGGVPAETPSDPQKGDAEVPAETRTKKRVAEVVVHLDRDMLGEVASTLDDGTRISPETFRRVACDCAIRCTQDDSSTDTIDVGRRTRAISPSLRRAMDRRDGGCRFPGCECTRYVEAHHIHHWLHGGETNMDNLVTLCTFHHQLLHEGGWSVERVTVEGGAEFIFRDQEGRVRRPLPHTPSAAAREAIDALWETTGPLPTDADPEANLRWDGDPPDYPFILSVLSTLVRAKSVAS